MHSKSKEIIDSDELEYMFYWNSNDNQWDGSKTEIWKEYQFSIQEFLNKKYKEFLNGQDALVRLIPPLENYEVDFQSYLQINIKNQNLLRFIRIEERQPNNKDSKSLSSNYSICFLLTKKKIFLTLF